MEDETKDWNYFIFQCYNEFLDVMTIGDEFRNSQPLKVNVVFDTKDRILEVNNIEDPLKIYVKAKWDEENDVIDEYEDISGNWYNRAAYGNLVKCPFRFIIVKSDYNLNSNEDGQFTIQIFAIYDK